MVLAASWILCRFEQEVANLMLKLDIPTIAFPWSPDAPPVADQSLSAAERLFIRTWRRFKTHLTDRLMWTGMLCRWSAKMGHL